MSFSLVNRLLLGSSLLTFALLPPGSVAAQDVTISDLSRDFYKGFRTVDGQLYHLLRPDNKVVDLMHLEIYGRDLQKKSSSDLQFSRNWYQGAARVIGDYTVFYFFTGKEGLLVKIDAAGQKVQETRFAANDVFGSVTAIEPAGNGDFYLTYPLDTDKKGYVVARYGSDLKTRWQKEFSPEKGKYRARFFQTTPTRAYVVADYSKAGWEVVCLDGVTGAEKSHQPLPTTPITLEPTMASVDQNGRLMLTGSYGEPQKTALVSVEKPGTPPRGGLFVAAIGPDGQQEFLTRMAYATELAGKLNTHTNLQPLTVRETPSLKWHALVPRSGGGYSLIGETYKVFSFIDTEYEAAGGVRSPGPVAGAGGPGPQRRYILDFVVVQLTAQGQFESIRRIPKPYKQYVNHSVTGPREFETGTAFAYRFLSPTGAGQLPEVVYLNWHQNLLYVNALKPGSDERDNIFTRRYLDQTAAPAAPDRGEMTVRDFSNEYSMGVHELFYDEILPHAPGKFLYTHYDPSKSSLRLQVLDMPGK